MRNYDAIQIIGPLFWKIVLKDPNFILIWDYNDKVSYYSKAIYWSSECKRFVFTFYMNNDWIIEVN